jgi:uncharacterized membrane protein
MTGDPSRLDSLEQLLARLQSELSQARSELATLRSAAPTSQAPATPATPATPAVAQPAAAPQQFTAPPERPVHHAPAPSRSPDLEQLAGRYGAIALAVVLIVMAAGALVSWAIAHGLLGPWVRVSLGALLALAIAATGWRLRAHGSRQYGDVLLAIALAVVHVVAWGAGPRLALVPSSVALAVADAASLALAALALRDEAQLMFCVGFGGALIAPFVTATGEPHYLVLAAYGLVLLGAAIGAIGPRAWWKAVALVLAGVVVYALSVNGFRGDTPWVNREFTALFAGLIAMIALARERKPVRPWIALFAVAVMALSITSSRVSPQVDSHLMALATAADVPLTALAGTALLFAAAHHLEGEERFSIWLLAIVLVPSLFLGSALGATGPIGGAVSGGLVLAWALAWATAALAERERKRGILLAASGLVSMWAILLVFDRNPELIPPLVAAHAVLYASVGKKEGQPIALIATGVSLIVAFMLAANRIAELPRYSAAPFLSIWSFGAACAVAAAFLSVRVGLPGRVLLFDGEFDRGQLALLVASVPAFIWGHLELRRAFSAEVATFLLTVFYAGCGVLAARAGRRADQERLREVGIALAVAGFLIVETHVATLSGFSAIPFVSLWSLGAAIAVGAFFFSARFGLPERVHVFDDEVSRNRAALLAPSALAFVWGLLELRRAFGADASTFLIISYFAACGVLTIRSGRRGGERRVRQAGLALSLFAAIYALERAWRVEQIALRVGSYLLVGLFLLGVAWWYRGEAAITGTEPEG